MARKRKPHYNQGRFVPRRPEKYSGDPTKIFYRSGWEFTFMMKCDAEPAIVKWSSETLVIPYFYPPDQSWHRYFPDFLVQIATTPTTRQTWLVEVKPFKETQPPTTTNPKRLLLEQLTYIKNQCKWAAAKALCDKQQWRFTIATKDKLQQWMFIDVK